MDDVGKVALNLNLPEEFGDIGQMSHWREWLGKALEQAGGKVVGGGMGMGRADVELEWEGIVFIVQISPMCKAQSSVAN